MYIKMLPMMKELLSKNVNVVLFIVTIQDIPSAHSHFEHFVSFPAFDKAKNAHMGRGALLGSKCMEIKASYVQARRFIDFHTLILNSYELLKS